MLRRQPGQQFFSKIKLLRRQRFRALPGEALVNPLGGAGCPPETRSFQKNCSAAWLGRRRWPAVFFIKTKQNKRTVFAAPGDRETCSYWRIVGYRYRRLYPAWIRRDISNIETTVNLLYYHYQWSIVRKPFKVGNVNLNYIFKMCRDNSKQR